MNADDAMEATNETGAAAALGAAIADPHLLDTDTPRMLVLPDGYSAHIVDPADQTDNPRQRVPLNLTVFDAQSFLDACTEYTTSARAHVFIDPVGHSVVGILNDDDYRGAAGRRDRRVTLTLTHTPEWDDWIGLDNTLQNQVAFVEFIEDHMPQIAEPAAADLYEIAQSLQASSSATFNSAVRLQSGTRQFQYSEDVTATAGRSGEIDIPETFLVGLAPWVGCDTVPVQARLRFRVGASGLALGFRLIGVQQILTDAFADLVQPIRDDAENCFTVNGRT